MSSCVFLVSKEFEQRRAGDTTVDLVNADVVFSKQDSCRVKGGNGLLVRGGGCERLDIRGVAPERACPEFVVAPVQEKHAKAPRLRTEHCARLRVHESTV